MILAIALQLTQNHPQITLIPPTENREDGRTVGSGRVAAIIE